MFAIIPHNTKIDFMGVAPVMLRITLVSIILSFVVMFMPGFGMKFGLDFSGGYEVLLAFDKNVTAEDVRAEVAKLELGDGAVQSYAVPNDPRTHYLVRVQRSEVLGADDLKSITDGFSSKYGANFKGPISYTPEMGNVIEVEFAKSSSIGVSTSSAAVVQVISATQHHVARIRKIGRPDQERYSIVLRGIDVTLVSSLSKSLDPKVEAVKTEFVGPAVGKQLRDDGVLAVFYTLLIMMAYIAFRFDLLYAPGAVVNVFHDAVLTCGFLVITQREFNLATVAGVLTLIGYSLNDTIIVYDRIRETVGKARGHALTETLNKAINETLARTIMTSVTVFLSSICLMIFGRGTVLFDFGLIMAFGVLVGTYSSIYVASPVFKFMRERFGEEAEETDAPAAGRIDLSKR